MKKFINLSSNKTSAILALLIVGLIVLGCGGKPEMPPESTTQGLIKTGLTDLAEGVEKGEFKTLRDKASADFQSSFTEAQLKSTFQKYIDQKDVIVPLLKKAAGKDVKFSPAPSMREEKGSYILVANGSIEVNEESVKELKVEFEWVWRDGAWKLLKIKV